MGFLDKNKKKIFYIGLFFVYFVVTFCFSTFILPIYNADEIWNYGFSYNISNGMIPYKDFSMLQTPLYFYVGSIFIKIFGDYLFSLHIFDAIFIALIMLILFKIMGLRSILLYPFLIITLIPSYNYFCLFFLFLIIYLVHEKKDNDLLISFIIGLIFMTKQSIGIVMFIPMIYYSKDKLKSLLVFLIPFIGFSIYFLFNDAILEFIDHCFLGMLDFNENNKMITIFTYIEVVEVLFMIALLFKNKFKDKVLFYILAFQVVSYPIFEPVHWLIAFIPFLYYLYSDFEISKIRKTLYLVGFVVVVGISLTILLGNISNLFLGGIKLENDKNNYLYLRNLSRIENLDLGDQTKKIDEYKNKYEYHFFIMRHSYLKKLYMWLEINKYDLLLDGNMGYKGDIRNIKEMDKICSSNSCVFFVENGLFDDDSYTQFSRKIYDYVINNYKEIEEYKYFDVYDNISD